MSSVSHHYNPQVYLRQFKNPKAKNELWEYDLATGIAKKSKLQDCGCEDYYNSVALEGGGRDDETPLERRSIHGEGLTDQDIGITFPLSRRVCACVDLKNKWTETHNEISAELVDTINHHTVGEARHFIYGPTMNAQIAGLVQEKFKKRQSSCQPIETK